MGRKKGHSWNVLTEKIGRTVLTFGLTLWVPRLLPEWSSKQTVVGIRIYNKQFKGTTFSMVLDVQVWFPWCKQQYLATIMQPSICLSSVIFFKNPGTSQHRFPSFFWGPWWSNFRGCDVENQPQSSPAKACFCFWTSLSEHNPKHPWYTPGEGILHASYSKPRGLFEAGKPDKKILDKGCISAGKAFIGYQ